MFLAGADGQTPELRAPSIKGAMRFWWRAMNGHLPLNELKAKEDEIFGGTDGKSNILIQCPREKNFLKEWNPKENHQLPKHEGNYRYSRNIPVNILQYLAYGVYDYRKGFTSGFFSVNQKFDIRVKFRSRDNLDEVVNAFVLLAYVGGLGSKSRNGYGKLAIIEAIDSDGKQVTISKWKSFFKEESLRKKEKPKFTSISREVSIYSDNVLYRTYDLALKSIGDAYIYARKEVEYKHEYNNRRYIGSPINQDRDGFLSRHAKTHFLTVVREDDGFKGYIVFLPYNYIEDFNREYASREKKIPKNPQGQYDSAVRNFNSKLQEKLQPIIL